MKMSKSRSGKTVKVAAQVPRPRRVAPANLLVPSQPPPTVRNGQKQTLDEPAPIKPPLRIPAILLEGDRPTPRPAAGPAPLIGQSRLEKGELPEAYGTGNLLLAARDPHWLYAHWDLTDQQQYRYNALSADHHLIVRVHPDNQSGQPMREIHLQPESRHWFIRVERAGTQYIAELGYYHRDRRWRSIASSGAAITPVDTVAEDRTVRWATIAAKGLPPRLAGNGLEPSSMAPSQSGPELASLGFTGAASGGEFPREALPGIEPKPPAQWTPARERALAEVFHQTLLRCKQMGSAEITELIQNEGGQEIPASAVPGISSLDSGAPPPAAFWLNINAELIVYGATEPDAQVTLGGRPIQLRPDGTFSCRFALPDGQYQLAVAATSARNDSRHAILNFGRRTEHDGEVGVHPQDQLLAPPGAENAS